MALRVDYVLRETAGNLRRNFSLTLASLLTVTVSLALVGASLLLRQGTDNATRQWQEGVEFIVYLNPAVTAEQTAAIGRELEQNPEVERFSFVNQTEALAEFKQIFGSRPEMVESVTAEQLPSSYRVVPRNTDAEVIEAVGTQFERKPGVFEVVFAADAIAGLQRLTDFLRQAILVTALVSLLAAGLLIVNTIRTAIFARRREIEVMKLVGATNWFIRVPFMLEGVIQGLLGSGLAFGAVALLRNWFQGTVVTDDGVPLLGDFMVSAAQMRGTGVLLLIIGVVLSTIGSGIAVSRYLDV